MRSSISCPQLNTFEMLLTSRRSLTPLYSDSPHFVTSSTSCTESRRKMNERRRLERIGISNILSFVILVSKAQMQKFFKYLLKNNFSSDTLLNCSLTIDNLIIDQFLTIHLPSFLTKKLFNTYSTKYLL